MVVANVQIQNRASRSIVETVVEELLFLLFRHAHIKPLNCSIASARIHKRLN